MLLTFLAAAACPPLPGIDALLARPKLHYLMLGEYHGTAEMPALVADTLCHAKASGKRVVLGIELPIATQAAIDRYARTGRVADLMTDPVWQEEGGRTTAAIRDLIVAARKLNVRIVAFDPNWKAGVLAEREQGIADALARVSKNGFAIVLTGAGHADKEGFTSRTPPVASAAMRLPPEQTISLAFARPGGSFWGCEAANGAPSDGCKLYPMPAREPVRPRGIVLDPGYRGGFDGYFSTGAAYSASHPARD